MRGFVKKAFRLPHSYTNPNHVPLRPQIRWYRHFVDTPSDLVLITYDNSWKCGNESGVETVDLSRSRGSVPAFPFSEALFLSHPRARFASNLVALRSLHSSKPTSSNDAPLFSTNPNEPITTIAERGSTQLSLREPQNKAGTSHLDLPDTPTRYLTRLVLGQSTHCRHWTRSRIGLGRVRCGR